MPTEASPLPSQPEPLPPIPAPGGESRAVLLLVNRRRLFLYWVGDRDLERRLQQARGPAEVILDRADGTAFFELQAAPLDFRAGSWYLEIPEVSGRVRARLGIKENGRFEELLRSNELPIPRAGPGTEPELWVDRRTLRAGRVEPVTPPERRFLLQRAAVEDSSTAPAFETADSGADAPGTVRPAPVSSPPGRAIWASVETVDHGAHVERGLRTPAGIVEWIRDGSAGEKRPASKAPVPPMGITDPAGYLAFVLHAHLPYVRHPERAYFLEEHWLFEGITETYLPILDILEQLRAERAPVRLTISLSPTLMAMLRDPVLMEKYERHLGRMCHLAWREVERTRKDPAFSPVAGFYWDRLHRLQHLFTTVYDRDLLAPFARLEDAGIVELITCAATHGFLPHHRTDPASVRAQVQAGVAEHQRQMGRAPRGLWIPECAYFEGLDQTLADAGIEYFFVDTHGIANATSRPRFGPHAPLLCPSGVAAFGRDEESSVQVWSSEQGYPGDPSYRDFYRDIGFDLEESYVRPYLDPAGGRGMTGFKYHRITGKSDHKEPYRRDEALRTAARHAADFVHNRRRQLDWLGRGMDRRPLVVSMYDAELFGHWWFEGPDWLELVLRGLPQAGCAVISPAQYLEEHPVAQVASPSESSWGERGYFDVWLTGANDWILPPLHDAARRMEALARRFGQGEGDRRRVLAQAGRELLLAQSSDWPFILRNQTTPEYAERRVRTHLDRFDRLARLLERGTIDAEALQTIESLDPIFPDLDARLWSRP